MKIMTEAAVKLILFEATFVKVSEATNGAKAAVTI